MRRILQILCLFAALTAGASDQDLERGIVGAYTRVLGMEATTIELRPGGAYVITVQGCLSSEQEGRGRWFVHKGVLLLDRRGDPKEKRDSLSRFEIIPSDGDLALRAVDDVVDQEEHDSYFLLFRRVKKEDSFRFEVRR